MVSTYSPLSYSELNLYDSLYTPSQIKPYNNQAFCFWQRGLFQRACSKIDIDGRPEEWAGMGVKDFLYWCLFRYGFIIVTETTELGLIFNPGTLSKSFNIYRQPTGAIITSPALKKSLNLEIGKDCEVVKLTPDYMGIWDIISYYAEKLALCDVSLNTSLINSKIPYILGAKTKGAAEALKKIFDKIHRGDPAAIYDSRIQDDAVSKTEPFQQLKLFGKDSYITNDLLETQASLLNAFDTEIGIQTLPYNKKERMVTAEANSKGEESIARVTVWLETLNEGFERVNKHYGTNLKAKLHDYDLGGGGEDGQQGDTVRNVEVLRESE